MKITVLSGGVGGARFTRGLLAHLANRPSPGTTATSTATSTATATGSATATATAESTAQVTVVANTGDDMWLHGVRVCPDLDTLMYTLGGGVHEDQGWGRRDESRRTSDDLAAYGLGWEWFTLGDLDLATHLARTELLRAGLPLSEVTRRLCERWQPGVRLLPATDQEVETHVQTAEGLIHFEEWWVRHRAALPATGFVQVGLDASEAAPGVLEALRDADVVVLPPSNPVVSIGTILAIPSVRDALRSCRGPVVGVSPIVGGAPVRGMADACLEAIGVETSARAVAEHYGLRSEGGILDAWLVDDADAAVVEPLRAAGWTASATDTLMVDVPATSRIARAALRLVGLES